jgi:hypothetical protein
MHVVSEAAAQGAESARAAIVAVAVVLVVFWRAVLRLLVALIAIGVVVLVCSGAVALIHSAH